jgi:hypothetical protein
MLALRSIKELEFDRAMGRVSDDDFKEMSGRLRTRAARLMRQLDAGTGYRDQIERELQKRLDDGSARLKPSRAEDSADARPKPSRSDASVDADDSDIRSATAVAERACAACNTRNDPDARFCKSCGQPLAGR